MYVVFVENRQYIVIFYVKIVTASDIYEYAYYFTEYTVLLNEPV
jgi:hypothetical protein